MLDTGRLDMLGLSFNQIGKVFDVIKEQLLAAESFREETELIFWVEEKGQADYAYVFRRGMDGYRHERCEVKSNLRMLENARENYPAFPEIDMLDHCQVIIRVFCLSPCFQKNCGKGLFEIIFQSYSKEIKIFLENLVQFKWNPDEACKETARNWFGDLPADIIAGAVWKFRKDLEISYELVCIEYINTLSREYYETLEGERGLIFLSEVEPTPDSLEFVYDFRARNDMETSTGFNAENISQIGKLLRMAQGGQYLVFDVCEDKEIYQVSGICEECQLRSLMHYEDRLAPYIIVKIRGRAQWDLYLGEVYAFSCQSGRYVIDAHPGG